MNLDTLSQIYEGKSIRKHIQEFAAVLALTLAIVAGFQTYFGRNNLSLILCGIAIALWCLGRIAPDKLYWPWKGWMKMAMVIGKVVTLILLTIVWVLLITPIALLLRLMGKRVIDLSWKDPSKTSYWNTRLLKQENERFNHMAKQY